MLLQMREYMAKGRKWLATGGRTGWLGWISSLFSFIDVAFYQTWDGLQVS